MHAKLLQSCLTLCNPMGCSPPGSSVLGDSLGKNTGVGCHAFLRGIFPTQGSNPGLPHCRQILYCLSHPGSCPMSKGNQILASSVGRQILCHSPPGKPIFLICVYLNMATWHENVSAAGSSGTSNHGFHQKHRPLEGGGTS